MKTDRVSYRQINRYRKQQLHYSTRHTVLRGPRNMLCTYKLVQPSKHCMHAAESKEEGDQQSNNVNNIEKYASECGCSQVSASSAFRTCSVSHFRL